MCIHKTECQYHNIVIPGQDIYPVHAVNKIVVIIKNSVNGIAIRIKMPAVTYGKFLAFQKRYINRQVRFHLPEQLIIDLHLHFQRLLWSLKSKCMKKSPMNQNIDF
jgi:hypothetical protein